MFGPLLTSFKIKQQQNPAFFFMSCYNLLTHGPYENDWYMWIATNWDRATLIDRNPHIYEWTCDLYVNFEPVISTESC